MRNRGILVLVFLFLSIFLIPTSLFVGAIEKTALEDSFVTDASGTTTMSRWSGLSSLKVIPDPGWSVSDVEGGVEYSFILNTIPKTNVFSMKLEFTNCEYYYQPPLTPAEIAQGCIRPDNVVGSYAVYSPYKDNAYGTGKVAHIYRPKVVAADGKWTWGVMSITNNVLSVTVDAVWLSKAVYPVVIDPEFGYTTTGASERSWGSDVYLWGTQTLSPTVNNIHVTSISAYIKYVGASVFHFKGGFWVNSDGGGIVDVAAASGEILDDYSWMVSTYGSPLSLTPSANYMLGAVAQVWDVYFKYDTGTGGTGHKDAVNSYTTPTAFDWTENNDYILSLYATYYTVPVITSSTITDMDDSDNCYAMKKYYSFKTEITGGVGATDIQKISVRGMQGANVRWLVNATSLDGVPAYAIITGASTIDLDIGSCSFSEAGNVGTLTLKIRFEWDYSYEDDCEIGVWAQSWGGGTVGWTTVQTDYFDVITRLVTYNFGANTTSRKISSPIELSGFVRYATTSTGNIASSFYPPDAQFTDVEIQDDEFVVMATDTIIVNGAFSVIFDSSSLIRGTTYYVWLDLVADYTDGLALDADTVYVTTFTFESSFNLSDVLLDALDYWAGVLGEATGGFAYVRDAIFSYFPYIATWVVAFTDQIANIVIFVTGMISLFAGFIATIMGVVDWFVTGTTTVLSLIFLPIGIMVAFFQGNSYSMPAYLGGGIIDFSGLASFMAGIKPMWVPLTFIALLVWIVRDGPLAIPGKIKGIYEFTFSFFMNLFGIVFWAKDAILDMFSRIRSLMNV